MGEGIHEYDNSNHFNNFSRLSIPEEVKHKFALIELESESYDTISKSFVYEGGGDGTDPLTSNEYWYRMALWQGWHVAPTNNGDNHLGEYARKHQRTGIWIAKENASSDDVLDALRNHQTFATEETNTVLTFSTLSKSPTRMGDVEEVSKGQSIVLSASVHLDPEPRFFKKADYRIDIIEIRQGATLGNKKDVCYTLPKDTWKIVNSMDAGKVMSRVSPDKDTICYYAKVTNRNGEEGHQQSYSAPIWVKVNPTKSPILPQQSSTNPNSVSAPQYITFALDVSGSMKDPESDSSTQLKIDRMKIAAQSAIESLDDNVRIGVIAFSGNAFAKVALLNNKPDLTKFLSNKSAALIAIASLSPDGDTNFADALRVAKAQFTVTTFSHTSAGSNSAATGGSNRRLIFMSDGQDQTEKDKVLALARDLGRMGVVIDTVALGFGERVDEARLREISAAAGGIHANTASYNMISVYNQLTARSQGHSLSALAQTALPSGETVQWSVPVGVGSRRARFLVDWQNFSSRFGLELISPSGRVARGSSGNAIPGLSFRQEKAFAAFTVNAPEPGNWTLRARDQSQGSQLEMVNMAVTEDNPISLLMAPLRSHYEIVEKVLFQIELRDRRRARALPIRDARVVARVSGTETKERIVEVPLRESSPGTYEGSFDSTWSRGLYHVEISANGNLEDGEGFARNAEIEFLVGHIEAPVAGRSTIEQVMGLFKDKG